jgi:hypothetical protein
MYRYIICAREEVDRIQENGDQEDVKNPNEWPRTDGNEEMTLKEISHPRRNIQVLAPQCTRDLQRSERWQIPHATQSGALFEKLF